MNSLRAIQSQFKFLTDTLPDFGTMPIFKKAFAQDLDLLEQRLTKEIIYETDYKTILTKLRTTFVNAFNSEFKERIQKYTRFDDQSFKDLMIRHMDFIEKYMLETILHQQEFQQLFKRAFMSLFGQDDDTFTSTMLLNVDQLQKQLDEDEFQEDGSMAAFWVVNNQIEVKHFRDTLLQHMGNVKKSVAKRTRHQRQYDRRVNKRQMQTQKSKIDTGKAVDADLVVTKSSGTESEVQDDSSKSGNDTDADDADIRPIYDEEPMAKVQLTAECNIFAIGQQHTEQLEISHEGRVDRYPEQCQV
ncbi:hypothetical protein Tco_0713892 [Tanacetum coccineum]